MINFVAQSKYFICYLRSLNFELTSPKKVYYFKNKSQLIGNLKKEKHDDKPDLILFKPDSDLLSFENVS